MAEVAMPTLTVVEAFDVIEQIGPSIIARAVVASVRALTF
jgi:hypothetical protein